MSTWNRPIFCKIFLNGCLTIREVSNGLPGGQECRIVLPTNQIILFAVSRNSSANNFVYLSCKTDGGNEGEMVKYEREIPNYVPTSYVSDDAITHFHVLYCLFEKLRAKFTRVTRAGPRKRRTGTRVSMANPLSSPCDWLKHNDRAL